MFRKIALATLVLTGCSLPSSPQVGSTSEAIVGGQNDGTNHPSVVMLYADLTDAQGHESGAICTGEVISPHVVLTAAHCVDPAAMTDDQGNPLTINGFVVYLGDDLSNDMEVGTQSNLRQVATTVYNPAFNINDLEGGNDIAVVVTTASIPETPMTFSQSPLDSSYVGKSVTIVGYGVDSSSDQNSAGVRRYTTTTISDIEENSSGAGQLIELGTKAHNTCHGDSGGPAIYSQGGTDTIIGITSFGDQNCESYGDDTDVGSYYASWLQGQIASAEANAAPDPTPDMAMATVDMATSSSPNSGSDPGNGNGGGLTVGETCQSSDQCESGVCTEGSSHYCTQSCELNVDTSCPITMKCELVGGSPYCVVPKKGGGCSMSAVGSTGAGGAASALGGVLLLLGVAFGLRFSTRRL